MNRKARIAIFWGAWAAILATVGYFVFGHCWADCKHLDPVSKFISEYASSAPVAWAISVAMVTFGISLGLVGLTVVLSRGIGPKIPGALLIIAALCMPFVALWPTHRVPKPAHGPIEYAWQLITLQGLRDQLSRNEEVARRHDAMIGWAMCSVIVAMGAMAVLGVSKDDRRPEYRRRTAVMLAATVILFFLMKANLGNSDGICQRLCFACILAWMGMTLVCFRPRSQISTTSNSP